MTDHITFDQLQRLLKYKSALRVLIYDRTMPEKIKNGVVEGHKKLSDEELRKLGMEMWNLDDFLLEVKILPTYLVETGNGPSENHNS